MGGTNSRGQVKSATLSHKYVSTYLVGIELNDLPKFGGARGHPLFQLGETGCQIL